MPAFFDAVRIIFNHKTLFSDSFIRKTATFIAGTYPVGRQKTILVF